jgi:hypothetical protein
MTERRVHGSKGLESEAHASIDLLRPDTPNAGRDGGHQSRSLHWAREQHRLDCTSLEAGRPKRPRRWFVTGEVSDECLHVENTRFAEASECVLHEARADSRSLRLRAHRHDVHAAHSHGRVAAHCNEAHDRTVGLGDETAAAGIVERTSDLFVQTRHPVGTKPREEVLAVDANDVDPKEALAVVERSTGAPRIYRTRATPP